MIIKRFYITDRTPSLGASLIPILFLIGCLTSLIIFGDDGAVQDYGYLTLLAAAAVGLLSGARFTIRHRCMLPGFMKSFRQIMPAIPILIFIGTLSTTWMLSGVVPVLINYGLEMLNSRTFLFVTCLTCAIVSVATGSSWSTIATVGVALMSVGSVMGYHPGWLAGAIISGAYFGDKVSPLSDTTVLASSSCGVKLFDHIRFMMLTSLPAVIIALITYLVVGLIWPPTADGNVVEITSMLKSTFNLNPVVMLIPTATFIMILLRCSTAITLAISSLMGLAGIYIFQPHIVSLLADINNADMLSLPFRLLCFGSPLPTGCPDLDPLLATNGIAGMITTIMLVVSAMIFGGIMIGNGMLLTITRAITTRLSRRRHLVAAVVVSGLFLNSSTGDQYLSIIIGSNIYKNSFRRLSMPPRVLSRTLEDSISVTSVLIPWNSCGITQSTVLGVSTLIYAPFCLFNILSPLATLIMAWTGWRIKVTHPVPSTYAK